ncbi:MAG: hypothetical protein M3R68_02230 [Acidobacteriota bacterium]|nr:hypothetical protein [Acidobacteriota bacterium]
MYGESNRVVKLSLYAGLLMPCLLAVALTAAAQGWSAAGSSGKSSKVAGKSGTPAVKVAKSSKSAKAIKTGDKTAPSGHKNGTTSVAGTGSDSAVNNGKRERRVNKPVAVANSADLAKPENKSTASAAKSTAGRCDPEKEDRTDLSGTYNGKISYPAGGLDGEATLTINGNRFTLSAGSKTETGNITAVTTCSYTAVAMMFGEWKTPQPGDPVLPPLPMLSLRAVRKGDQFRLIVSPSETRVFSFDSGEKK